VETDRPAVVRAWLRAYLGPLMIIVGLGAEFLGWWGVSGESDTARQLPYIASGTVPGAALIVGGAILVASGGSQVEAARRLAELHALLVEPAQGEDGAVLPETQGWLAVPEGTVFHTSGCALVAGKAEAEPVTEREIAARGLAPCPVCGPREG
jgi:hypothetical protein